MSETQTDITDDQLDAIECAARLPEPETYRETVRALRVHRDDVRRLVAALREHTDCVPREEADRVALSQLARAGELTGHAEAAESALREALACESCCPVVCDPCQARMEHVRAALSPSTSGDEPRCTCPKELTGHQTPCPVVLSGSCGHPNHGGSDHNCAPFLPPSGDER